MDGLDKAFIGLGGAVILLWLAFWGIIFYVGYRILTHFGIV